MTQRHNESRHHDFLFATVLSAEQGSLDSRTELDTHRELEIHIQFRANRIRQECQWRPQSGKGFRLPHTGVFLTRAQPHEKFMPYKNAALMNC